MAGFRGIRATRHGLAISPKTAPVDYPLVSFVLARATNEKRGHEMTQKNHPQAEAIVLAIKALPAYTNPKNLFESELSECFEDSELVEEFGFDYATGEPHSVKMAVKSVLERCEARQDAFGWIVEEGEREREFSQSDQWQDILNG